MTIRKEECGWKTLGRKRAERIVWILYDTINSAKMKNTLFPQELIDEVKMHHAFHIVNPLTELLDEICKTYKIKNPNHDH
jgi:hypothetical protein